VNLSLRIVGGKHRGRRIGAPEGPEVRPTSDRAREALFNILEHGQRRADGASPLVGARVLDAFAGSGALGLEALSRGAAHAVFMDSSTAARAILRANAKALGEAVHATVLPADATQPPPAPEPCDLVFLDPPYGSGLGTAALTALAGRGWIADGGLCSVEIGVKEQLASPPGFAAIDDRRYGKARIILLRYGGRPA